MFEKPIILSWTQHTLADLERIKQTYPIWKTVDIFERQLGEFFVITHPDVVGSEEYEQIKAVYVKKWLAGQEKHLAGAWVYFSWSGVLLHMLDESEYTTLRTNRNRNLITQEEQEVLRNSCVAFVGLSVGSNIAVSLSYSGIANTMKLADFDTLDTSNLNRVKAPLEQVGLQKAEMTARLIYESNPFADLVCFLDKITTKNLTDITSNPRPSLIFEIMDSFEIKIHLRRLARAEKIPVIMVTNLGDRVLLDVERYDLNPQTEFFNGRAGNVPDEMLAHPDISAEDKHAYAVALAGVEHIPARAQESVKEIGKSLIGRPQLMSTVTTASGLCVYLAKQILLGNSVSGSWLVDFDKIFRPGSPFFI
ncbi:MAG TPA: hypothetical protein DCY48_03050 [Candidatus Magasanikbacteria bacterium]|nr:MAG: hypothetical protein A3I74_05200 [Candidatus Magasanikbacteria bacterium RIFCSPLOWO2_02_FULL_47_16]OGH79412.1 MAG: hypothetical protein A3C10_05035 [Candidatus Magasanikbacteria bacterium RIFCSPHIGHO2_02_FULL_48_18]OGH83103.1 MAG: hypothetical protein A3G08_01745 [Candidatus Magasanikbacteria bacterium RIFCSPLOWO2_12_FULL_47_9b]HAZ28727.1 hypothetical protein [Candidatus Magasanikbacteria bacterium]